MIHYQKKLLALTMDHLIPTLKNAPKTTAQIIEVSRHNQLMEKIVDHGIQQGTLKCILIKDLIKTFVETLMETMTCGAL